MFQVVGALEDYTKEYKGASNFPVGTLTLVVGNNPIEMKAIGAAAHAVEAKIGEAPVGTIIKVRGNLEYRTYNDMCFIDLNVGSLIVLGAAGQQDALFEVQGFVGDVKELQSRKGETFYRANLKTIAFNRDDYVDGARVELSLEDDDLSVWRDREGEMATVVVKISGYRNAEGRIYHSWRASTITYTRTPGYLASFVEGFEDPDLEDFIDDEDPTSTEAGFTF